MHTIKKRRDSRPPIEENSAMLESVLLNQVISVFKGPPAGPLEPSPDVFGAAATRRSFRWGPPLHSQPPPTCLKTHLRAELCLYVTVFTCFF